MPVYQIFLSDFINPVHFPVLNTEAVLVFEMLVPLYQTKLPYAPEDSNFTDTSGRKSNFTQSYLFCSKICVCVCVCVTLYFSVI